MSSEEIPISDEILHFFGSEEGKSFEWKIKQKFAFHGHHWVHLEFFLAALTQKLFFFKQNIVAHQSKKGLNKCICNQKFQRCIIDEFFKSSGPEPLGPLTPLASEATATATALTTLSASGSLPSHTHTGPNTSYHLLTFIKNFLSMMKILIEELESINDKRVNLAAFGSEPNKQENSKNFIGAIKLFNFFFYCADELISQFIFYILTSETIKSSAELKLMVDTLMHQIKLPFILMKPKSLVSPCPSPSPSSSPAGPVNPKGSEALTLTQTKTKTDICSLNPSCLIKEKTYFPFIKDLIFSLQIFKIFNISTKLLLAEKDLVLLNSFRHLFLENYKNFQILELKILLDEPLPEPLLSLLHEVLIELMELLNNLQVFNFPLIQSILSLHDENAFPANNRKFNLFFFETIQFLSQQIKMEEFHALDFTQFIKMTRSILFLIKPLHTYHGEGITETELQADSITELDQTQFRKCFILFMTIKDIFIDYLVFKVENHVKELSSFRLDENDSTNLEAINQIQEYFTFGCQLIFGKNLNEISIHFPLFPKALFDVFRNDDSDLIFILDKCLDIYLKVRKLFSFFIIDPTIHESLRVITPLSGLQNESTHYNHLQDILFKTLAQSKGISQLKLSPLALVSVPASLASNSNYLESDELSSLASSPGSFPFIQNIFHESSLAYSYILNLCPCFMFFNFNSFLGYDEDLFIDFLINNQDESFLKFIMQIFKRSIIPGPLTAPPLASASASASASSGSILMHNHLNQLNHENLNQNNSEPPSYTYTESVTKRHACMISFLYSSRKSDHLLFIEENTNFLVSVLTRLTSASNKNLMPFNIKPLLKAFAAFLENHNYPVIE